ncbi:recombinase family protein [Bradyrhizobium sp. 18BD]
MSYEIPIASGRSVLPTRAAQYVRMSRDSQRYSTANQAEVIAAYARDRNITIVRTYADEGLSGLAIHWRDGLKALIADVESGHAEFDCVLVYDVTRWGRFQNLDESAYYEFMCQRAGITVPMNSKTMAASLRSCSRTISGSMPLTSAGSFPRRLMQ